MMNILTFDTEEWFHLLDFDATRTCEQWKNYPVRIYDNVDRILDILESTNNKATFFIVGWIAKTYPEVVRKISQKYEIASHGFNHQLVWQQTPAQFKEDLSSSIKLLEDISGKKIRYYRAPGFSIGKQQLWALEIIQECGIEIDCSIFAAHASHGGMKNFGKSVPSIIKYKDLTIKEMPVSIKNIFYKYILFSTGGYFRFYPYGLIRHWTKQMQKEDYFLAYFHPRDFDANQPVIANLPMIRKFKSYIGLKTSENKFRRYLTDFHFVDITTAKRMIDWQNVPIISHL